MSKPENEDVEVGSTFSMFFRASINNSELGPTVISFVSSRTRKSGSEIAVTPETVSMISRSIKALGKAGKLGGGTEISAAQYCCPAVGCLLAFRPSQVRVQKWTAPCPEEEGEGVVS
jgi:hypothetical protein